MKDKEKLDQLLQKVLSFVQKRGYKEIKTTYSDEYDDPKSFKQMSTGELITPLITALDRGHKHYFELAMKHENVQDLVSKWKLMILMANHKKGVLHLFAPRGHKAFVERLCEDYKLEAKVIAI
ncbi:MAG: hypothetical protein GY810_07205 [Aureispira sp.]|nr:hypothetical protein [Aureispira sp.]